MYIPQPCHENWSAMTPAEHGRVCASCNSLVADMTRLTNEEILSLISTGNIHCGRFYENQLQLPEVKRGWLGDWLGKISKEWMFISLMTLLELTMPERAEAKTSLTGQIEEIKKECGDTILMPGYLQGAVVKEGSTLYPLINKEVLIYNSSGKKLGVVTTDANGMFAFALPEGSSNDSYTLITKGFKHRGRYRIVHYHKTTMIWSPADGWAEIRMEATSRKKLFRPKPIVTGKFRM